MPVEIRTSQRDFAHTHTQTHARLDNRLETAHRDHETNLNVHVTPKQTTSGGKPCYNPLLGSINTVDIS